MLDLHQYSKLYLYRVVLFYLVLKYQYSKDYKNNNYIDFDLQEPNHSVTPSPVVQRGDSLVI